MTPPLTSTLAATPFRLGLQILPYVLFLFFGALLEPSVLWAQTSPDDSLSLVERYRSARVQILAQKYLSEHSTLPTRPARSLPTHVDSLFASSSPNDSVDTQTRAAFPIDGVRRVRDLERSWFRDRYRDVQWSFLGPGMQLTFFDTTRTRRLRARLQAVFGAPTRTLAELYSNRWANAPDSTREDPIQFEYWFIVNDSLPVRVSDVGGPLERGVIVSTARRHRDRLHALREALLHPLRQAHPAPYVDYYYEEETRRWYRVGFDGQTFFRERISRFDIVPGRRPTLDTARTAVSPPRGAPGKSPSPNQ